MYNINPLAGIERLIIGLVAAVVIMVMVIFGAWVINGTGPAMDERAEFQQEQRNQILQQGDIK